MPPFKLRHPSYALSSVLLSRACSLGSFLGSPLSSVFFKSCDFFRLFALFCCYCLYVLPPNSTAISAAISCRPAHDPCQCLCSALTPAIFFYVSNNDFFCVRRPTHSNRHLTLLRHTACLGLPWLDSLCALDFPSAAQVAVQRAFCVCRPHSNLGKRKFGLKIADCVQFFLLSSAFYFLMACGTPVFSTFSTVCHPIARWAVCHASGGASARIWPGTCAATLRFARPSAAPIPPL